RPTVAANLGVVAHAPQQTVGDAGRAAGAPGDLRDRLRMDLDVEDARRPAHDALQLWLGIEVQPVDGAEAVAQRPAQQTLASGGADAGEVRQRQGRGARPDSLAEHGVESTLLERA